MQPKSIILFFYGYILFFRRHIIPGLLLSLIFVLLIENHKLKNENKLR
ncbi:hypothetical protein OT376_02160 [Campylobacter jejuni]|nr:hypothetical protein [Campylobacter jejuni]